MYKLYFEDIILYNYIMQYDISKIHK